MKTIGKHWEGPPSRSLFRRNSNGLRRRLLALMTGALLFGLPVYRVAGQTSTNLTVVFEDDFSSDTLDPAKFQPDSPFFEGGQGDIHAELHDGVVEFVGSTTQQWWSGATLRIVPTFSPSESETVHLSIDRVAEAGEGTASRSALWIMDETQTQYVLFADVRGEGGWHYNRKIGQPGDVPTGGGTDIVAFNLPEHDDGGLHRMGMIADGRTVKLLLDGVVGAEVPFPFSPVVFHFGSYARANGDTASTTWDNLRIEISGSATFLPTTAIVPPGQTSPEITVRIPQGSNNQNPVQVRVVSGDPNIAVPEGGTNGALTLDFPAGGANTATFRVRGTGLGGTEFSLEGDIPGANRLAVEVVSGASVQLEENFSSTTIDTSKWEISNQGFETGTGTFDVTVNGGMLEINGTTETDFWPGASLKTARGYVATDELNLVFEVDRVLIEPFGTAGRTGVYVTTDDRSRYVFFGQNVGENNWQVNVNPGNPTGGGTTITAFADVQDTEEHRIRMVANGETVEIFLDGESGGRFPFEVTSGIHFEIGAYARATTDSVRGVFDDARIEYVLPCSSFGEGNVLMTESDAPRPVTVRIPQLLNAAAPVSVTVTSQDPGVAIPVGAVNGVLTLNFAAGAPNTQTIQVQPFGRGTTTFQLASTPENCVAGTLAVEVVATPEVLLEDDFSGNSIDLTKWTIDSTPFDIGTATPESSITVTNGQVLIEVIVQDPLWPGLALFSSETYSASEGAPLTFEIDRTRLDFVLTTGTGAEQRTGIWIRDENGNFVFFSDYVAHDGRNFGWRYNKLTGDADDDPTGEGVNMAAFDGAGFDDQGDHRMKLVANGETVKLYLDDILGAEVPFPSGEGLSIGFGAYADEAENVVRGYFDNARITGGEGEAPSRLTAAIEGGNVVISWTGAGTLQEADTLGDPAAWRDVTPPPAGTSITIPIGQTAMKFYRLRQ